MSMLAEKKRKQKWSLNPRGKDWVQDSNKFGQKLLEKMGWTHGKGLGAKEDGRTEHIKVSYKNDSQGMGYKESNDQWTEHESNYTALLRALGGGEHQDTEAKLSSLEKKSESSKARVHYRKFTRGKDLSRYSEKDLANIFGKKSLKETTTIKESEIIEQEMTELEEDKNFSNAGLMSEYFKKKLPDFGKTGGYVIGNNGVLTTGDEPESENEQRPSFGFEFSQNNMEKTEQFEVQAKFINESIPMKEIQETSIHGEKKKKKKASSFISYMENENNIDDQIAPKKKKDKKKRTLEGEIVNAEDTPTKKKRLEAQEAEVCAKIKKDKTKKVEAEAGLFNPAFDPLYSPVKIEKHVLDPIEESINESVNRSLNDTLGQVAEQFEVQVQIIHESTPVKKREESSVDQESKKKKKKDKNGISDENKDASNANQSISEVDKVKQKKKKQKATQQGSQKMDTSVLNSTVGYIIADESDDISRKEKKKNKRKGDSSESTTNPKEPQEGVDNPFFNISTENDGPTAEILVNPYEVRIGDKKNKKNSKSKENQGVANPVFNGTDNINSQDLMNEEYEVTRKDKSKKKKRKTKEANTGLDNPALSLSDSIEEGCDLMLNVVSTPLQISQDKRVSEGAASIHKVKEVARRKSVRFSDVTRERIIPNKEELANETLEESRDIIEVQGKLNDSSDLTYIDKFIQKKKAKKRNKGLDNVAFDQQANKIEENITSISKTLDTFQAEIENDINEAKMKSVEIDDIMVGEVGNPDGTNEKLPDGTVKLKFKYAKFKQRASYIESLTGSKKSYKHLIKGDIVMGFKETNLHEIEGYAITNGS